MSFDKADFTIVQPWRRCIVVTVDAKAVLLIRDRLILALLPDWFLINLASFRVSGEVVCIGYSEFQGMIGACVNILWR